MLDYKKQHQFLGTHTNLQQSIQDRMLENYLNHRLRIDSLSAYRGSMTMPLNLKVEIPLKSIEEITH